MLSVLELGLIALVRSAMTGQKASLPEGFSMAAVVPMAKKHQIAPILLQALSHFDSPEFAAYKLKLMQSSALSLSISETQMAEAKALCEAFSEAGIDHAPLKGVLIKQYYPVESMRSMADIDILIRKNQYHKIEPIMKQLGYTFEVESDHEYNWRKGHVHAELHKCLVPSYNKDYYSYYKEGWQLFHPTERSCYAMRDEDLFIYLFTHYTKHFRDGGIGIKHLTDLWVFRRAKPKLDEAYILQELKKLRLDEFYGNVMQTAAFWFDDGPQSEMAERMTREIISCGAYGKADAQRKAEALRNAPQDSKHSKLRWTLKKIFLPYKNMCQKYPFLRYLPFLLPIMWVVRWVTAVFFKPKKLKKDIEQAKNMSQASVDEYRRYLESMGLRF
ncbi:MAG: hypothetical protein E7434_09345 [Ruminococcaceae bacterium]|nr:hypothetical protein [Oscillospiraceae bacterium]